MAKGKRPSGGQRPTRHPHTTYLKTANGEKHSCWKAGEIYGCPGHRTYTHQPCIAQLTDGALVCPYCKSGIETVFRAYVPVWDQDWTLRHALIGEDIFESVDAIPHLDPVCVTRGKNPISPLIIRPQENLLRPPPRRAPWDKEVDMLAVCLTLWQDEMLAKWFATHKPAEEPKSKAEPKKSNGKPFSPMTRKAAERYSPPADERAEQVEYEQVVNRLKQNAAKLPPASNGNGKH